MLESNISFCIQFNCPDPINKGHDVTHCNTCGSSLLVNDRYRLIKKLHISQKYMPKLVYEAIDIKNDNKIVILKIIDFTRLDLVAYLEREYNFLLTASYPFYNVNRGDYFEWQPDPEKSNYKVFCLVIPKLEGVTTDQWVQENGPLSEVQCLEWILEVSDYLKAFAELRIIYRDLKPDNIIFTPDEGIELIDFGSIKEIDEEYLLILDSGIPNESRTDIRRGTRIFTYAYAPPEQLRGQAVPQSDFYALGRTIVFWLSGKNPEDLVENGRIDIAKYRPDLSKTFIHFLNWLLEDKASARPFNAECLQEYLHEDFPYLVQLEHDRTLYKNKYFKFITKISVGVGAIILLSLVLIWLGAGEFFQAQAQQSLKSEDYSRALREAQIAQRLKPHSKEALKQQGFACIGLKDYECADRAYREALRKDPSDALALYQLGITQEALSKYELARDFYQRSIQAEPSQIDSQLRLVRLALEGNSTESAQSYLTDIQKQFEAHPERVRNSDRTFFFYYQGWYYLSQNQYEESELSLLKAYELFPEAEPLSIERGDVMCLLAEVQQTLKRSKDAMKRSWNGCFMLNLRTLEAARIKDAAVQKLINILAK